MDKPELLEAIQRNHPTASLELIKELSRKEITRQLSDAINGMLNKKPLEQLQSILDFKEEVKDVTSISDIVDSKQNIKVKKRR